MRRNGIVAALLASLLAVGTGSASAAPGGLDHSFSGDGRVPNAGFADSSQLWGIAVDSQGRIVAAGYRTPVSDPDQFAAVRFLG